MKAAARECRRALIARRRGLPALFLSIQYSWESAPQDVRGCKIAYKGELFCYPIYAGYLTYLGSLTPM